MFWCSILPFSHLHVALTSTSLFRLQLSFFLIASQKSLGEELGLVSQTAAGNRAYFTPKLLLRPCLMHIQKVPCVTRLHQPWSEADTLQSTASVFGTLSSVFCMLPFSPLAPSWPFQHPTYKCRKDSAQSFGSDPNSKGSLLWQGGK